jgi:hypothetical protein
LPNVKKWFELVARQLKSFFDGTGDIPRIIRHMPASSEAYSGLFGLPSIAGPCRA